LIGADIDGKNNENSKIYDVSLGNDHNINFV
ncbi:hypothetical protein LCGC14_2900500, partial [marine sediment metagenome]